MKEIIGVLIPLCLIGYVMNMDWPIRKIIAMLIPVGLIAYVIYVLIKGPNYPGNGTYWG